MSYKRPAPIDGVAGQCARGVLMGIAIVVVTVTGCLGPVAGSSLTVSFSFYAGPTGEVSTIVGCRGVGGYGDVRDGLDVIVKNQSSSIIGKSTLQFQSEYRDASGTIRGCLYGFEVGNLASADFYTVEVGKRGALTYSRAELDSQGWLVAFELGDPPPDFPRGRSSNGASMAPAMSLGTPEPTIAAAAVQPAIEAAAKVKLVDQTGELGAGAPAGVKIFTNVPTAITDKQVVAVIVADTADNAMKAADQMTASLSAIAQGKVYSQKNIVVFYAVIGGADNSAAVEAVVKAF